MVFLPEDDRGRIEDTSMSDRLRKTIDRELTAFVDKLLAEAIARGDDEVPVIGDPLYADDPDVKQRIIRALVCREWFKTQCPPWGQPLALSEAEISALYNRHDFPDRRLHLVANYAIRLRGYDWRLERVEPFCLFCLEIGRAMGQ
jgi:hypothetical protein